MLCSFFKGITIFCNDINSKNTLNSDGNKQTKATPQNVSISLVKTLKNTQQPPSQVPLPSALPFDDTRTRKNCLKTLS